ncbi:class I SAM-dependent methyltransferase [Nocardioides lijunqiniae]|uniref:class I SAM-dependent methyltransferase n=1 Tax=Nocardioides lijunqiniae TaxID=2760832 RepID=UPI001878B0B9|nr:class I SAM-dependent methyltransferase [Nocardioides lijunqiniae]
MFDYDAELSRYQDRLRAAAGVQPDDHVLDIGCGTGLATRDAARSASSGGALGVDLSVPMLEEARRLAADEGVANVRFEQADVQVHPFAAEGFSLAISRFGTMFFDDPLAAFGNVARSLRPGSRLVQLVWAPYEDQEWSGAVRRALAGSDPLPEPAGLTRAAFSLADPAVTTGLLEAAGLTSVEVTDVREPVHYGADADAALEALSQLGMTRDLVADKDEAEQARALDRLREVLEAHDTGEGVWFDARAWLVTAVRA